MLHDVNKLDRNSNPYRTGRLSSVVGVMRVISQRYFHNLSIFIYVIYIFLNLIVQIIIICLQGGK